MNARIACLIAVFCSFCAHRFIEAARNDPQIVEDRIPSTIGASTEDTGYIDRSVLSAATKSSTKTLIPLIDESMDIEPATGFGLKFSDIPEGSVDSLWKTLVAGSGDTVTGNTVSTETGKVNVSSSTADGIFMKTTTKNSVSDFEGSGDWNDTSLSSQATSSPTQTTVETQDRVTLTSSCFTTRCNSSELDVPGALKFPQASEVLVSCSTVNNRIHRSLSWYFTNGSELVLIDRTEEMQINLTLQRALVLDSGVYKCVKLSEIFCCHVDVELRIYEIPNYENHILIVGVVAVCFLVICLILVVLRNRRNEKRSRKMHRCSNGTTHELLGQS